MNHDGGMRKGGWPLLRGEPARTASVSAVCWRATCFRRGGNHPRPGLPPEGETEKGAIKSFLAAAGYQLLRGDRLSLQLRGHFIVATTPKGSLWVCV